MRGLVPLCEIADSRGFSDFEIEVVWPARCTTCLFLLRHSMEIEQLTIRCRRKIAAPVPLSQSLVSVPKIIAGKIIARSDSIGDNQKAV